MRNSHVMAEVRCAAGGVAGMVIALSVYCGSLSPAALLPRCSDFGSLSPLSMHLAAVGGMALGTWLTLLWTDPTDRIAHIRSGMLAALGMSALHWNPGPQAFLFSPSSAVIAVTATMLPGMLLGHAIGWLTRGRSMALRELGVENERMWR